MNKRLGKACRILCMVAWLAGGAVQAENWSNNTDVSWYSAGPSVYSVGTAQQLAGLAKLVNEGNTFAGKTIRLTANADLSGKAWTPIGVWDNMVEGNSRPFSGIFDGQGWTIDGLSVAITNASSCVSAGFFGSLVVTGTSTGTVQNLILTNLSVTAHSSGEAAYAAGVTAHGVKGVILNCVVAGSVTATTSNKTAYAGGVAGYIEYGFISNCTVSMAVSAVARESVANNPIINGKAGGVMGDMSTSSSIVDCMVTGSVIGVVNGSSGFMYVGGVAGSGYAGTIRNCAFSGAVNASCVTAGGRLEAGGIMGGNQNGVIRDSRFTGDVTASSDFVRISCAGGIAGRNYYGLVLNSLASGSVAAASKSHSYAGGVTGDDVSGSNWNCSASGSASAFSSAAGAGAHAGLVASLDGGGSISNCLARSSVSATSTGATGVAYAGGLAGRIVSGKAGYSYWKRTGEPGFDREASGWGTVSGPCLSFGTAPGTLTNTVTVPGTAPTANLLLALNQFAVMRNNANPASAFKFWAVDGVQNGGYPFLTAADPRITVAFDAQGGEFAGGHAVTNVRYFLNGPYGTFPAATRIGYFLTAWTNPAGVAMTVESTVTAEGTNLYAQWGAAAITPEITPGETAIAIGCGGTDDYAVGVTSNIAWTVSAGEAWISVTQTTSGFTFDAATNEAVVSRSADIELEAEDMAQFHLAATVTVTQAASPVVFGGFEHGDSTNVPYAASSGTNGFTGNSPWRVETGEAWIGLTPPTSGNGNGSLAWTLEANAGAAERVGTVRLIQTGELGAVTNLFTITQAAGAVEVTFNANGGEFEGGLTVTSVTYALDVPYGQFPAVTRFGMVFGGWTNGALTLTTGMSATPEPTELFALWNAELSAPVVLPPSQIGAKGFVARWRWVEGRAPEGELAVAADAAFNQIVPGYETRYVLNVSECAVAGLLTGRDYWYRVRRVYPEDVKGAWSAAMRVRTGQGMPAFKKLLSEAPMAKGISQQFAISNLVAGTGTVKVNSSNTNAVKATVSGGVLTLQSLWKNAATAKVTLTLTHPTGYKAVAVATVNQATGVVAISARSALTNAGTVVAQEVTLVNRTGGMVYGVRLRTKGLEQPAWLINRTGLDPVSKAPIREIPCVMPAGSQMVVRLVYARAYKTQATTRRPVTYGAWAILTPVDGKAGPVDAVRRVTPQALHDGLWLLGVPANRNRAYTVEQSDDDGATWTMQPPLIRATANYMMWLDPDDQAPDNRIYRVVDVGM